MFHDEEESSIQAASILSAAIILQGLRGVAEEAESGTRCLVQGQGEHVLRGKRR